MDREIRRQINEVLEGIENIIRKKTYQVVEIEENAFCYNVRNH